MKAKTVLVIATSFMVLLGLIACSTSLRQQTQGPSPIQTPLVSKDSTSSCFPTPTQSPTRTQTPVPSMTPSVLAVEETTPTPVVVVVPPPTRASRVPHNVEVPVSELASTRFIGPDTVVYLQDGNLRIHNLSTQTSRRITDGGDITSFDWSEAQRQYSVVKGGRLLLLDATGDILTDWSAHLMPLSIEFEAPRCRTCHTTSEQDDERVNLLEHITWVTWGPAQNQLVFASDIYGDGSPCCSIIWSLTLSTDVLYTMAKVSRHFPHPWWLNDEVFMIGHYLGGGSNLFDVIRAESDEILFSIQTWASTPVNSPDGRRLAARVGEGVRVLEIFDIAAKQKIYRNTFPDDTILELDGWSHSGRYLALTQSPNTERSPEAMYRQVILNVDSQQLWELLQGLDPFLTTWLPDTDELLVFSKQNNDTNILLANPVNRSITLLGEVANMHLYPESWSSSGRYLTLHAWDMYNRPSRLWIWDKQVRGLPFPIYQVVSSSGYRAWFRHCVWSPNDDWLLFTQSVGITVTNNPYAADITLQAFHLPSGSHHQIARWAAPQ